MGKLAIAGLAVFVLSFGLLAQNMNGRTEDGEVGTVPNLEIQGGGPSAIGLEVTVTVPEEFDGRVPALMVLVRKAGEETAAPVLVSRILPFGSAFVAGETRSFAVIVPEELSVRLADPDSGLMVEVVPEVPGTEASGAETGAFKVQRAHVLTGPANS